MSFFDVIIDEVVRQLVAVIADLLVKTIIDGRLARAIDGRLARRVIISALLILILASNRLS
ncbi:hypothetical protein [Mesorhizobium sp. SP-1A]|uniref:hypothetical protein n=1 Tax=Mesorhizobium sp. SP-1A TaxID=3077840 RepID=UPI0028F6CD77|nr:hypothetical protein [Mesorhizobium sp. SP-1A]